MVVDSVSVCTYWNVNLFGLINTGSKSESDKIKNKISKVNELFVQCIDRSTLFVARIKCGVVDVHFGSCHRSTFQCTSVKKRFIIFPEALQRLAHL